MLLIDKSVLRALIPARSSAGLREHLWAENI
jgi:hypothetical protein